MEMDNSVVTAGGRERGIMGLNGSEKNTIKLF